MNEQSVKLELKYFAPYRPYGLDFIMTSDWDEELCYDDWGGKTEDYKKGAIWRWAGYVDSDLLIGVGEGDLTWVFRKESTWISIEIKNGGMKPLLYSLSDLTKEIEYDGEKFVPLERLAKTLWEREPEAFNDVAGSEFWVENQIINKVREPKGYDDIPHWAFQDLIKWHFDLFGLIPAELAVPKPKGM